MAGKYEKNGLRKKDGVKIIKENNKIHEAHPLIGGALIKYRDRIDKYMCVRYASPKHSIIKDALYPRIRKAITGNKHPF